MEILEENVDYVNEQISFYKDKIADKSTRNTKFFQYHLRKHERLLESLLELQSISIDRAEQPVNPTDYTSIRPEDIEGLPKEVLAELGLSDSDHAEFDIINFIKKHGGIMSLDHIIIRMFHETGEVQKRKSLTAKLYRMVQKGLLFNVPDKRATYSVSPVDCTKTDIVELPGMEDLE